MTELVERPPPSENTTMHLIMEQKRIATRYGDSIVRNFAVLDPRCVLTLICLFTKRVAVHRAGAHPISDGR